MGLSRTALIPLCTSRVSQAMAKIGAKAPRTRYIGRQVNLDEDGRIVSGVVRTLCSFLTASGFERELEVPVMIYMGEVVDPALAVINGNPALLSTALIEGISDAGTITETLVPGGMYCTAYSDPNLYRELCDSLKPIPRLYRPLY